MSSTPTPLADFEEAQTRAIDLIRRVRASAEIGQSERDLAALAQREARERGFQGFLRPPRVVFGAPRSSTPWARPRTSPRLETGMVVELELNPHDERAFGHVGISFALGEAPPIVQQARELCRAVLGYASRWKCVGELFVFAEAWANNRRGDLGGQDAIGYRAMGPAECGPLPWPQGARAWAMLRRNQVQYYNHRRMNGLYLLRPRASLGGQGALFAEMIWVTPDEKRILGRAGLETIGA